MLVTKLQPRVKILPLRYFAIVAISGMVAFIAAFQGISSLGDFRTCTQSVNVVHADLATGIFQFFMSILSLLVLLVGIRLLKRGLAFQGIEGYGGYLTAIVSLLIGEGLLSFVFLELSRACAS